MALEFAGMNFSCVADSMGRQQLPHNDCVLPLLSKLLGYVIIALAAVSKFPQIYLILKNKSIKGVSTAASELEIVGFTIALAYCMFKRLPFSAYGELVFLLIQSVVQIVLMYYFSPVDMGTWLKTGLYCGLAPPLLMGHVGPVMFEALYAFQHAVFMVSKVPQIVENFQNKSTGQLSIATNFVNFGVCVARLFTSVQEKAPPSMVVGCVLGIITNGIVVYQIFQYSSKKIEKKKKAA